MPMFRDSDDVLATIYTWRPRLVKCSRTLPVTIPWNYPLLSLMVLLYLCGYSKSTGITLTRGKMRSVKFSIKDVNSNGMKIEVLQRMTVSIFAGISLCPMFQADSFTSFKIKSPPPIPAGIESLYCQRLLVVT